MALLAMSSGPYASLPPERARAVDAWLRAPLGSCRFCGESVHPTESRRRDPKQRDESVVALVHLPCLMAAGEDDAS